MPAKKPAKPRRPVVEAKTVMGSPEQQIAGFLAKYTHEMVASGKNARARMRQVKPGGFEFVYDNYNALVFRLRTQRPPVRGGSFSSADAQMGHALLSQRRRARRPKTNS